MYRRLVAGSFQLVVLSDRQEGPVRSDFFADATKPKKTKLLVVSDASHLQRLSSNRRDLSWGENETDGAILPVLLLLSVVWMKRCRS